MISAGKNLRGFIILKETFIALRHPNYRLWFIGQLTSLVGSWMQTTAQGYLVYTLTRSPMYLGIVGFASGVPVWLFMLYGGVIADRISRRVLLIITQAALMLLAFILAGLVFTGLVQPWHIVVLSFFTGVANAFDAPARQSFVVELVERQDLTNAIALNSMMFNAATVVGPAVAGVAYAIFGAGWCFMINGVSFIAVVIALSLMRLSAAPVEAKRDSAIADVREGLRYVASNRLVLTIILSLGMLSIFGISMMTLLPAWSVNVLGGDVKTNGLLLSARGFGALIGALVVATLGRLRIKGKLWTMGNFLMPVVILGFSFTRWLPLALGLLVGIGWSFMIQSNTSNAMVQMQVPDHLRGRVMSIFTLTVFGGSPVGSLLIGQMATIFGEPAALQFCAVVLVAVALFIWMRRPELRSVE